MFKELQHCFNSLEKTFGPNIAMVVKMNEESTKLKRKMDINLVVFIETAEGTAEVGVESCYPFKKKQNYVDWVAEMTDALSAEIQNVYAQLGVLYERAGEESQSSNSKVDPKYLA